MSFPFAKILSPIDFDEHSLIALDLAANIARQNHGVITLLTVVPMEDAGGPVYVEKFKEQAEIEKKKLEKVAKERLRGVKHEILSHLGDPASAILKIAEETEADLIVMATHGREGISRALLGSVAEKVLREAPCPVLSLRLGKPK